MKSTYYLIFAYLLCSTNVFSQASSSSDSINFTDSKGLKQGKWIEYYSPGKIKDIFFYVNDTLHGLGTSYYKNGKEMAQSNFNKGKQDKVCKSFHENGKLRRVYVMDNGKPIWFAEYNEKGVIIMEEISRNGYPFYDVRYKNGLFIDIVELR